MIHERYAAELLVFSESVSVNPRGFQLEESLSLTENLTHNLPQRSVSESLSFTEVLVLNKVSHLVLSETLTFIEGAKPRVYVLDLVESLNFIEETNNFLSWSIYETLEFVESLTVHVVKPTSETLDFVETLTFNKTSNFTMSETLAFTEGVTVYKPSKSFIVDPVTPGSSDIKLTYGATELTFRKYIFGNVESVNYSRINRKSSGGDIIVASASANVVTTLQFTIRMLSGDQLEVLQNFLHDTVGQEIVFRDHEAVDWEGVIITPNNPKVQTGRNTYSISLEFQGVRI